MVAVDVLKVVFREQTIIDEELNVECRTLIDVKYDGCIVSKKDDAFNVVPQNGLDTWINLRQKSSQFTTFFVQRKYCHKCFFFSCEASFVSS